MLSQGEAKGHVSAVCTHVLYVHPKTRGGCSVPCYIYAPVHSLGTGSLIEPGARLGVSELSGLLVSTPTPPLPHSPDITGACGHAELEMEFGSSCLHSKPSRPLSHLPRVLM